jgi:hypothetical protein
MKFLEGKSPAEKKKLVVAITLGTLAVLALGYSLYGLLAPAKPYTPPNAAANASPSPGQAATPSNEQNLPPLLPELLAADVEQEYLVTPVPTSIFSYFPGETGRNIFAFYEPPPPTPYVPPTPGPPKPPTPMPTPTATPPPPLLVAYFSPNSIYAGSKSFRLEVTGDKFTPETAIYFNGAQLPTSFVNGQKLAADVPANLIAGVGSRQIEARDASGKLYSNPVMMQVLDSPKPQFNYIGIAERRHRNNDTVYLQDKGKTDVNAFRLNDVVGGRFRLVSISVREIVVEDTSLGFRHRVALREGTGAVAGAGAGRGVAAQPYSGAPPGFPGGLPAGIPPGTQIYVPPNANRAPDKKDYEDDEDGDN